MHKYTYTYVYIYIYICGAPSDANSGGPAPASMPHTHLRTHTPHIHAQIHKHTWCAISCELRWLITVTACADWVLPACLTEMELRILNKTLLNRGTAAIPLYKHTQTHTHKLSNGANGLKSYGDTTIIYIHTQTHTRWHEMSYLHTPQHVSIELESHSHHYTQMCTSYTKSCPHRIDHLPNHPLKVTTKK